MRISWTRETPWQVWASLSASECRGKYPQIAIRFRSRKQTFALETRFARGGRKIGEVVEINIAALTIDIKKTKRTAETHPKSIFVGPKKVNDDVLADALFRLGSWVNGNGVDSPGPYRAARDLLLRHSPRLTEI